MNADRPGGPPDASLDLEQASAKRLDLCRALRLRELEQAKQVDQVVGEAVQEQPEGVGQETVTSQPVGPEAVLELLDGILAFAAVVVKGEDRGGTASAVGDEETQIGADGGVLGLLADAALARPGAGAMAEAGEAALGELGAAIAAREPFLGGFGPALKERIGGDAQGIFDAEKLAKFVEQRLGETGIAA